MRDTERASACPKPTVAMSILIHRPLQMAVSGRNAPSTALLNETSTVGNAIFHCNIISQQQPRGRLATHMLATARPSLANATLPLCAWLAVAASCDHDGATVRASQRRSSSLLSPCSFTTHSVSTSATSSLATLYSGRNVIPAAVPARKRPQPKQHAYTNVLSSACGGFIGVRVRVWRCECECCAERLHTTGLDRSEQILLYQPLPGY